jgi:hypothetical protein
LHFAKKVPSVPVQRRMQLGELVAARRTWPHRVTWRSIFAKATSILSARHPELRRAYMKSPFPRLYEHPKVIANIAFERDYKGAPSVFIGRVPQPQLLSLGEIDRRIRHFQTAPINEIPDFCTQLFLSRWPWPIRRLVWWVGLNVSGLYRSWYYGTFAVSVVAALGASSLHPLSPLTTVMNYSPFDADGSIEVRFVYDHRVFDGAMVARFLSELEEILRNEILAELRAGPPGEENVQSAVAAS